MVPFLEKTVFKQVWICRCVGESIPGGGNGPTNKWRYNKPVLWASKSFDKTGRDKRGLEKEVMIAKRKYLWEDLENQ